MYKDKGLIKAFNGTKFKIVSYLNEGDSIIFTTSRNSKKYSEFKKNLKAKIEIDKNNTVEYDITIIEDEKEVDALFKKLKDTKAILPFIPRKHKIIVRYSI
ncbi:MAG: hypothetical protein ACK5I7_04580 [Anaerotignum sp.]